MYYVKYCTVLVKIRFGSDVVPFNLNAAFPGILLVSLRRFHVTVKMTWIVHVNGETRVNSPMSSIQSKNREIQAGFTHLFSCGWRYSWVTYNKRIFFLSQTEIWNSVVFQKSTCIISALYSISHWMHVLYVSVKKRFTFLLWILYPFCFCF